MLGGEGLWEILHAGDWFCAHGDDEGLRRVAMSLAKRLDPERARVAQVIAKLAFGNLEAATLLWGHLASELRHDTQPTTGQGPGS